MKLRMDLIITRGWSPSVLHNTVLLQLLLVCTKLVQGAPPESLGIPIIPSNLDAKFSQGLKQLVQTQVSSKLLPQLPGVDPTQTKTEDINSLINKLNPKKKGRMMMHPAMVDMLSALDRTYRDTTAVGGGGESSAERFPDETASNRVPSSTEENGIIWQDAINRPRKRERDSTRFSSRYRSNKTKSDSPPPSVDYDDGNYHNVSTENGTEHSSSGIPFGHVTDPNLRNHRLYAWEFETYKNFTHIDQAEDLMADEDHATETKLSVVAAPPPSNHPSQQEHLTPEKAEKNNEDTISNTWSPKTGNSVKSKRVKVKGMPHIVITLDDTSENNYGKESYNLHFPAESGERSLNQRPREPLRHGSTENIVYVHGDSGEEDRYPYSVLRDPGMQELDDRYVDERSSHQFRPSATDRSDAVFMNADQDFFTSTVRNSDGQLVTDQEISSETLPKRRRKKFKKITKKEQLEDLAHAAGRYNNGVDDRRFVDSDHPYELQDHSSHGIQYSPEYSKNSMVGSINEDRARAHLGNIQSTPGPHLPLMKPTKYAALMENNRMKSDRVLSTGGDHSDDYMNQGQASNPSYDQFDSNIHHHHDGGIGNYYSLHSEPGLHANLGSTAYDTIGSYGHKNNYDLTSTEYLGSGNRIQNALNALNIPNIFSNQQATKKLQAAVADQVIAPGNIEDFYHPYAASDHQVNQYYEDSYATSWSNTWFILAGLIAFTAIFALLLPMFLSPGRMGKKDHRHDLDEDDLNTSTYQPSGSNNNFHYDNTNNDVTQNSDVWTEIKGVYNDLVNMFRGDYGLLSKLKRVPDEGPKIVYRDEEVEDEDSEEEEEEDDEKTDNRVNKKRNRKRDQYIKKQQQILQKQQQQELKRQQQQQQQQSQQQQLNQAKSQGTKKTLVSKSKAEAGRDNKDNGKTINASSVNNLVVVSGPGGPTARKIEEEDEEFYSSPRTVTGFVLPDNDTLATMPMTFINATGFGNAALAADSFLREWAQIQLINNH